MQLFLRRKLVETIILIAIVASLAVSYFAFNFYPLDYFGKPVQVSYCEMGNNPNRYHRRFIRVKAPISYANKHFQLYNLQCDFGIEANATAINFDSSFKANPSLNEWMSEFQQTDSEPHAKTSEAIVTGWFDGYNSPGCWIPKYALKVVSIEPVSKVTLFKPNPQNSSKSNGIPVRIRH